MGAANGRMIGRVTMPGWFVGKGAGPGGMTASSPSSSEGGVGGGGGGAMVGRAAGISCNGVGGGIGGDAVVSTGAGGCDGGSGVSSVPGAGEPIGRRPAGPRPPSVAPSFELRSAGMPFHVPVASSTPPSCSSAAAPDGEPSVAASSSASPMYASDAVTIATQGVQRQRTRSVKTAISRPA